MGSKTEVLPGTGALSVAKTLVAQTPLTSTTLSSQGPQKALKIAAVATVLALFFATKDSFHQHALGLDITWGKNLWWKAMEWYAWGLLAPIIFKACRKFSFSTTPWRTVAAQLGCGAAASLAHCCVLTTGARIEAQVLNTGMSWPELFIFIFAN